MTVSGKPSDEMPVGTYKRILRQAGLAKNPLVGPDGHFVRWFAGNSHFSRFRGIKLLPMAALLSNLYPSVAGKQTNDLPDFHAMLSSADGCQKRRERRCDLLITTF